MSWRQVRQDGASHKRRVTAHDNRALLEGAKYLYCSKDGLLERIQPQRLAEKDIHSFQTPLRHNSLPTEGQSKQYRTNEWRPSMSGPLPFQFSSGGRPFSTMPLNKDQPQSASDGGLSASSDFSDKSFLRFHSHSLSGSTFCSNDSSPTTTCSLDDSSNTEPSPGSSPESPPLVNSFQLGMQRPQSNDEARPFFELQQVAPPKKGRNLNLKNLAVNTSRKPGQMPSLTGIPPALQRQETAPSIMSPSFVKPPEPPKRRPSNLGLTILTPSSVHSNSSPQQIRLAIPATPGFGRPGALRHFQSSPSLPLLTGFHDEGKNVRLGPLDTIFSPLEVQKLPMQEEDEEQNFDIPLSREEKPEAYPDGPINIYSPYVDLFLEPTAEQARQYDVVMNVASEVRNPFDVLVQPKSPEPEVRLDGGGGLSYAPKRVVQTTEDISGSPTTPKATPLTSVFPPTEPLPGKSDPEYIHIPWEHNSDIVPDLLRLVKFIDERVDQGKRVLIHCQCGVSRSASLIVAYGLYKNPTLSVQEAYDRVKAKSKWIGPNMNLIMQLQEFRSSLARGGVLAVDRNLSPITPASAMGEWRSPFSMRDVGPHSGASSAGLLHGFSSNETSTPFADIPTMPLTAGPRAVRPRAISAVRRTSAYVDPAGHIIPVVEVAATTPQTSFIIHSSENDSTTPTLSSPRSAEFAMSALQPPKEVESMDDFGLMSPTTTEFSSNPFDRSSLLASLGMTTHSQPAMPVRTKSLRSETPKQDGGHLPAPQRKLRSRISSPSLKEQRELHSLQAQIEARLPQRQIVEAPVEFSDALMSPRATEFTSNPFALAFSPVEPTKDNTPPVDPRSPAQKGASPIIRNIEQFL
ncbi:hypothetical protein AMS68_001464 [Peltaster fructicola]|uniref:protein-tyrosine-phosphatase n=1 Tax=Peltaster fructicola TaxID=286661 RepID=A0A6H0XMH1_9PEZI|nr:hypothetical protein AMS68_001464 [Peltaster fructicola]